MRPPAGEPEIIIRRRPVALHHCACLSRDNGATRDLATEVQIRNDFNNWDVGYPESLELPSGRVFSVYYFNVFGKYLIDGSSWKP